jgi:hypothetical protein
MSPRFRNKLLTAALAAVASIFLVGTMVVLDVAVPAGMHLGWLIKTAPLAVVIPAVLIGYDALCDWYYSRFITGANEEYSASQASELIATSDRIRQLRSQQGNRSQSWPKSISSTSVYRTALVALPINTRDEIHAQAHPASAAKRWIGQ